MYIYILNPAPCTLHPKSEMQGLRHGPGTLFLTTSDVYQGDYAFDLKVPTKVISQKLFTKSFCRSQFPHKSVNLSFIMANINNKLTDLCVNGLLQNDFLHSLWHEKAVGNLGLFTAREGRCCLGGYCIRTAAFRPLCTLEVERDSD